MSKTLRSASWLAVPRPSPPSPLLPRADAVGACARTSSRHCSVASERAPPQIRTPFPNEDMPRYDAPRQRRRLWRRHGLLRARLRRPLISRRRGSRCRARRNPARASVRRAKPLWSMAAISTTPRPKNGKSYSDLPNAFRYRNEIVAGCTCNGKDPAGLAPVKVEDDPTLRKGDIVAGAGGLVVANRSANDRRGVAMNFSPLPESVRARFRQVPVVAKE